ncbi:MAG: hypothetical protein H0V19_03375, partial [Euzebyales bacterium]|nr:hypothetical protein [Euzebyales bacterium]
MRLRDNLHRRLAAVGQELVDARESLRVSDEQLAYLRGVADDAETGAVVSGSPLAAREAQ